MNNHHKPKKKDIIPLDGIVFQSFRSKGRGIETPTGEQSEAEQRWLLKLGESLSHHRIQH